MNRKTMTRSGAALALVGLVAVGTPALADKIAAMPAFGLALAKRAVNQCEDQMGLRNGMDSAFGLHHDRRKRDDVLLALGLGLRLRLGALGILRQHLGARAERLLRAVGA